MSDDIRSKSPVEAAAAKAEECEFALDGKKEVEG